MNWYLVMTRRLPGFDPQWIDAHYAFLEVLRDERRLVLARPSPDGSGGAYLLRAASFYDAQAVAVTDPLSRHKCSAIRVHEWRVSGSA